MKSETADKESKGAEETKGMPIGNSDFRDLRDNDMFFVDKSMFIDRILRSGAKVTLITRPRRFGKSLNLDMTDCYLNVRYAGERDRFEGLRISEERPDDPEKNSNIVIKVSLKDLGDGTYESFLSRIEKTALNVYRGFLELRDSDRLDPALMETYNRIYERRASTADLETFLADLSKMLETHYGKKVIILIDEYDNAMNNAYGMPEEHKRIVAFMRTLLSTALKDNDSLRFAVLTGVMKVSKESIFSGLNNLEVDDVFSTRYDEMFGFTQDEVDWLLRENGYGDKIAQAKRWYDGYRFGDQDVYNPWSIINYIKNGCKPEAYWAGTSGNSIIGDLVSRSDQRTWRELESLCEGGAVMKDLSRSVAYCDIRSTGDVIYSIMVAAGYLNAVQVKKRFELSIPNKEMFGVFAETILDRFGGGTCATLGDLIESMESGDAGQVEQDLDDLMEILSERILNHEFQYEAFIAGLMAIVSGRYEIFADHEAGNGYFDIRMKRISGRGPNLVLEIKRRNEKNKHMTMEQLAQSALKQIHDQKYYKGLEGETILYGIAFEHKEPTVVMEMFDGNSYPASGGRSN